MKKVKAFFKKYPKSCMFLGALLVTGVIGALGQQFADNAKTQAGFVVWCVIQAICIFGFAAIVYYLGKHGAGDPE